MRLRVCHPPERPVRRSFLPFTVQPRTIPAPRDKSVCEEVQVCRRRLGQRRDRHTAARSTSAMVPAQSLTTSSCLASMFFFSFSLPRPRDLGSYAHVYAYVYVMYMYMYMYMYIDVRVICIYIRATCGIIPCAFVSIHPHAHTHKHACTPPVASQTILPILIIVFIIFSACHQSITVRMCRKSYYCAAGGLVFESARRRLPQAWPCHACFCGAMPQQRTSLPL